MVRIRPCSVPDCHDKVSRRYHIPTDKVIRDIWLQRIGNPKLSETEEKNIKYYVVCANHFHSKCIQANGILLSNSLPSLKLKKNTDTAMLSSFLEVQKDITMITPEKVRDAIKRTSEPTRLSPIEELTVSKPKKIYPAKRLFGIENAPSTSKGNVALSHLNEEYDEGFYKVNHSSNEDTVKEVVESRTLGKCNSNEGMLTLVGVKRHSLLSPHAKTLYLAANKQLRTANRVNKPVSTKKKELS
ncbi:unnamed protein product [Psylliodes chrysocephalus]|uniref:THAP-type domain-containing protein n=1 Tax=Psylliodes chrysocephalus TaxID=3402493 RepID=A0A9P0GBA4_9CUCU|nr:unnamed protein product [Psylliodes chrysocephala]